jgi:adenine-specific DNA-methyltransferase
MDKLDMQSPDLVNQNFEKLAELFPNCVTESATGKAIDFDLLKQELNHAVVEGNKERYRLEWPGKRESIVTANLPTTKTLRPVREDSVDFDNTENIYIEGDNLEVLKVLQESYLGKIKMIYLDPPYNTGNDFVYKDNFAKDKDEELLDSGQKDELSQRLVVNPESSGRYHSDWLSMIYPRLKLARNLLKDDGVIFVSIDVNESANLRKILEEIFGEGNLVGELMVVRAEGGGLAKQIIKGHDTLFVYAKNITNFEPLRRPKDIRGKVVNIDGEDYWIEEDWLRKEFGKYGTCPYDEIETYYNAKKKLEIDEGLKNGIYVLIEKSGSKIVGRYRKISEDGSKFYSILKHLNKNGVENLAKLSMDRFFDFPKPVSLIKELILGCTFFSKDKDAIVLDFFGGSSTTAQAALELNSEDKGKRKFILVQVPEAVEESSSSFKNGFKTIADIGKERIRRAAKQIKAETEAEIDYGFRMYRLDESNMQDVYYSPQDLDQNKMDLFGDNVKPDRTEDDLLVQVMLDWGLPLSLKIEQANVLGKKIFKVADNSLFACFDTSIDEAFAKEIAKEKPLRIVFKDAGFKDDTAKTNVKQLLKQLSPETEMKVL